MFYVAGNLAGVRSVLRALRWVTATELVLLIALAAAGAIYEQRCRARDRREFPPPGRLVDLGGYKLHIQCAGPSLAGSPTVVLDSGLVGSVLDWRRVFPQVARFARVCAYDRGGYGWSESSPRHRDLDGITADLHDLLEKSGERPPYILVGHSLGGLNLWAFASRYPAEAAGLVLVDSAHPRQSFYFPYLERVRMQLLRWTLPFGLPRWRGWCGGPDRIRSVETAVACQPRYQRSFYQQRDAMPQYLADARRLPALGSLPGIVVSRDFQPSRADALQESRWRDWQQDLSRIFSVSSSVTAEGSGHDIPNERPDVIVQAIRDLLARINRSS